ncbi:MAG TPA: hypothetical protein VFU17_06255 [Candidatus Limnocylindrales bacterium]|nr:hypothetical protein [Candidatus Limnocylindrales bacterium]
MIRRALTGRGYWLIVAILVVLLGGLGGFLAIEVVLPEAGDAFFAAASPTPVESPTPGASAAALAPMAVRIPADSDCAGCHAPGDAIAITDVPRMAHPIDGWRDCTACHADDRLVRTAPGHSGIHRQLCLACHREPDPDASALPRPHHVVPGKACIACHGSSAPLPTDMTGRANCWVCHPGKDTERLFQGTSGEATPSATPADVAPTANP